MSKFELRVPFLYLSKRIDVYLVEAFKGEYSRREIKEGLEAGKIFLNGKSAKPKLQVVEGDLINGELSVERPSMLEPESIPLKVVYEDDWLLVIDKPSGMVVHPGAGNKKGTLVHALLGRGGFLSTMGGEGRPGIVHRLDKETSGLLVVAKNNQAHRHLQEQFASRTLSKTYVALVRGQMEFQEGYVERAIGRHPKIRYKMAVVTSDAAKDAQTRYCVTKRYPFSTLLEVKPQTGRTHQIRVHMTYLGHPLVGDAIYGTKKEGERLALHASKLEFRHPKTGKIMTFESELPDDFKQMITRAEVESR